MSMYLYSSTVYIVNTYNNVKYLTTNYKMSQHCESCNEELVCGSCGDGKEVVIKKVEFTPFCPFESLGNVRVSGKELLVADLRAIFKSMNRKMTAKVGYRNSRVIDVDHTMHYSIFLEFFRVIRDIKCTRGVYVKEAERYKSKKDGRYKSIKLEMIEEGRAKEVLVQIGLDDVGRYFTKELDHGMRGAVVLSSTKPLKISFSTTSSTLFLKAHYQVTNEFGIVV